MRRIRHLYGDKQSSQGFSLLEIALALAILSVVAIYTLDMYQGISSRKKLVDDRGRMQEITNALKAYFSGHEALPDRIPFDPSHPVGDPEYIPNVPVTDLSLGQSYRFDTHGRPYFYFRAISPSPDNIPLAAGFDVDGKAAAGVVISFGENQTRDYVGVDTTNPPDGIDDIYTTNGDDLLVAVEVNVEAVAIALAELEILGKRVEAYNREFAGIQDNAGTDYYGDITAGAPPVIDPDYYDQYYPVDPLNPDLNPNPNPPVDPPPDYPELYPYTPNYLRTSPPFLDGSHPYQPPNPNWPDNFPSGISTPPPTFTELVQAEPINWPGAGAYGNDTAGNPILRTWDNDIEPTSANLWRWPPQGREPAESNAYIPFDGARREPPFYAPTPTPDDDFFGEYPDPPLASYELIDEGGCNLVGGVAPADPSCGSVFLDNNVDPLQFIVTRYGLGSSLLTDPWGNSYQWDSSFTNTDLRYHLFFSRGPDGISGTMDDILLF